MYFRIIRPEAVTIASINDTPTTSNRVETAFFTENSLYSENNASNKKMLAIIIRMEIATPTKSFRWNNWTIITTIKPIAIGFTRVPVEIQ